MLRPLPHLTDLFDHTPRKIMPEGILAAAIGLCVVAVLCIAAGAAITLLTGG